MKVLDASFLIDYEAGVEATKEYLLAHDEEVFVIPSVTLLEFLLGDVHGHEPTNLVAARELLGWAEVHPVTERTVVLAAEAADEIGPQGPRLSAPDALGVGTARELGATLVSRDRDQTHPETAAVVEVDEFRSAP
jgi:predicted nucleic acid-binding protein